MDKADFINKGSSGCIVCNLLFQKFVEPFLSQEFIDTASVAMETVSKQVIWVFEITRVLSSCIVICVFCILEIKDFLKQLL